MNTESAIPSSYVGTSSFAHRNTVLATLSNAAGMRLPTTIIPEGESLLPIGEENKRRLAGTIEKLPNVADGLLALRERVRLEAPVDATVPLNRVRMEANRGGLFGGELPQHAALGYTSTGFGHVLDYIRPSSVRQGFNATMQALPVDIRAQAFNHFAERSTKEMGEVVLRTHLTNVDRSPRRVVRAVTSTKFTAVDDVDVLAVLNASLPNGAKLRVTREDARTDLEIIWPAMDRQLKVGDIALIALQVTNSETKQSAIKVQPKLLRVLCYNFTTAYTDGADEEVSIRHVGEAKAKLAAAFRRALTIVEPFVRAFGDAYKVELPTFAPTRGEVLKRVGSTFELPATTLEAAARLWDADGAKSAGNTLAGLAHALTRASQEETMDAAAVTENAAGRLVSKGWASLA